MSDVTKRVVHPEHPEFEFLVNEEKAVVVCKYTKQIGCCRPMVFEGKVKFDQNPFDQKLGEFVSKRIASARYHGFMLTQLKGAKRQIEKDLKVINEQITRHEKKRKNCGISISSRYHQETEKAAQAQ